MTCTRKLSYPHDSCWWFSTYCVFSVCDFNSMLPSAASFHFPWELKCGEVQEGESVRTFGRLTHYNPDGSRATLSAQHASKDHQVVIHTSFVEPFNPIIGAQYIVLGEVDTTDGTDVMIRARVLNCVDGVNVALLQKAINEQRSFFQERDIKQSSTDVHGAEAT